MAAWLWSGATTKLPGINLVGAGHVQILRDSNNLCWHKETKGGAGVHSTKKLARADEGKRQFHVNINVSPANLQVADQKNIQDHLFPLAWVIHITREQPIKLFKPLANSIQNYTRHMLCLLQLTPVCSEVLQHCMLMDVRHSFKSNL